MTVTNAIVIYFAFGMPFGVLSIGLLRGRVEPIDVFRVIYDLVFWPLLVFKTALAYFRPTIRPRSSEAIFRASDRNHLNFENRADRRRELSHIAVFEGM